MSPRDTAASWDFSSDDLPYREQLYRTALRMTRSVEDAEDLVQDTYLKAFRHYCHFEEGTNLKAWLFRIMKNGFINGYRRKQRTPRHVVFDELRERLGDETVEEIVDPRLGGELGGVDRVLDHEIRAALLALPHDYRMAVLLVDLEGYTYQEVADMLVVPIGTVMSRLYRARKKLERSLLAFGRRYNYLDRAPERLRDPTIDPDEFFGAAD